MSDSAFFTTSSFSPVSGSSVPELIHSSENGWSEIYIVDKDGKFRILKALKKEYAGSPQYEALLRKEFEIGYRLAHPNLCEIYSYPHDARLGHCIEMEWVNGQTLKDLLCEGPLTEDLSKRIILQLCNAVAYCHSCQVIHRDIKPENIMVTHTGHNVKLIDFGISDSDAHSMFKTACGTDTFAAPELYEGATPNILSDVYSIGKVLALLHPAFRSIAAQCTRKDPSKRYRSVEQIREAVESLQQRRRWKAAGWAAVAVSCATLVAAVIMKPDAPTSREALEAEPAHAQQTVPAQHAIEGPSPAQEVGQSRGADGDKRANQRRTPKDPAADYEASDIDELFNLATELLGEDQ